MEEMNQLEQEIMQEINTIFHHIQPMHGTASCITDESGTKFVVHDGDMTGLSALKNAMINAMKAVRQDEKKKLRGRIMQLSFVKKDCGVDEIEENKSYLDLDEVFNILKE